MPSNSQRILTKLIIIIIFLKKRYGMNNKLRRFMSLRFFFTLFNTINEFELCERFGARSLDTYWWIRQLSGVRFEQAEEINSVFEKHNSISLIATPFECVLLFGCCFIRYMIHIQMKDLNTTSIFLHSITSTAAIDSICMFSFHCWSLRFRPFIGIKNVTKKYSITS